jgi:hypothetical protein
MPDIFISYSRRDSEFVHKLVDVLQAKGRDIWVDFDDIPFGSDWWAEIVSGVESSSAAIFCISPDSIQSQVCSLEIAQIIQNRKKLVPIVVREPGEHRDKLPQEVSNLNWLFFTDEGKFDRSLTDLLEAIDTDLELEKDRTRLLVRAREWEQNGHNNSMLLRGEELEPFLYLLDNPNLMELQRRYLEISRRHDINRQQVLRFASGFLAGVVAFGFYVFAVFRSDSLISPKRLTLTLAGGEIFGLFIGIMAVFGQDVVLQLKERIPKWTHLPLQILLCIVSGILAWVMFQGVILEDWPNLLSQAASPILLGGLGLAAGFIVNAILKPPAIITVLISFIGIYLPIWALNNFGTVIQQSNSTLDPLLYFDFSRASDVYWVGIPMALLLAIGANLQQLWRQYQPLRKPEAA